MLVLVVDDEPAIRQVLAMMLVRAGYEVEQAANVGEANARLDRGDVDVCVCDIKMPDGSGIDVLTGARAAGLDTTFLMVTAFASVETAVEALRAGAADYMTKPVRNEELLHRIGRMAAMRGLRVENRVLRRAVVEQGSDRFHFRSPVMAGFDRLVAKVAPTDSTVLITGESGTGKGVAARAIHEASPRRDAIFLPVNCGAIPEQLLESEFFGHTKGAYTGADRARKGLFIEADRGTLFLDEIGELPLHMQTKLLHAIEEKTVRPVGSDTSRRVEVRIVAATNRDLAAMVREGRFREDLYFRLGMFQIRMPPLRERVEDLPGLVRHLLRDSGAGSGASRETAIDVAAERALLAYPWPGNVRELENVLNRARILCDDQRITPADLPEEIARLATRPDSAGTPIATEGYLRDQLRAIEARLVQRVLDESGDDRRVAAQKLGIGLSSLYRKLEEFERLGLATRA